MRALFWLIAAFAAAVALAIVGRTNDGYALFVYPPYRVELSLTLFAVLLAGAFVALYLAARFLHHVLQLPMHVRTYRERRRRTKAQDALFDAAQAYLEGRYARAERAARQAVEAGAAPSLAALLAARAAHALRAGDRRDAWLERAADDGDSMRVARLVTKAELLLEDRDFAAARAVLRDLHDSGPRHIATLRLLLRAELGARNWDEVLRLIGVLAKRSAIAPALYDEYKGQALTELLGMAAGDAAGFEARWRRLSARDRLIPRVASAAARHAARLGLDALSREIIEAALAEEWDPVLVELYGAAPASDSRFRLQRAERWLLERPGDAQLLRALGRLCVQCELWGKAQNYLEASLSFEAHRETHVVLARLFERLGRTSEASHQFRLASEAGENMTPLSPSA